MRLALLFACFICITYVLSGCGGDGSGSKPNGELGPDTAKTNKAKASGKALSKVDKELPALPAAIADALQQGQAVVHWAAHTGARLEPCGCVAGMHGGLVRRASLLSRLDQAQPVIRLETGGWSGGKADYQLIRAGYYLQGLELSGCHAIGLGRSDIALGSAALQQLSSQVNVPTVCANIESQIPGITASTTIELGGQAYCITSVVPADAKGAGLSIVDPAESLLNLQADIGQARLIVMADLKLPALKELAGAVPGIQLIVGGDVSGPSQQAVKVGGCHIVHVANEGKTIGWWPWGAPQCEFELITDTIPDHPELRTLVHAYQEDLGKRDLDIDERIAGMTNLQDSQHAGNSYVGPATCMACHPQAGSIYHGSRHAHSLDTLKKKNYHNDPDCLRCHVTGLSRPGGFSRRHQKAGLDQVGCEACHGHGAKHVEERSNGRAGSGSLAIMTPATCTRCHDAENSPHFAYPSYWEKIKHGSN